MTSQAKELLLDLLRLKVRYSDMELTQAAEALKHGSDPFFVQTIQLLQELESITASKPTSRTKKKVDIIEMYMHKMTDPEIKGFFVEINQMLQSKDTFRLVKELRSFISRKVLLTAQKNTKSELIHKYFEYISASPRDEIRSELQLLKEKVISEEGVTGFLNMANAIVSSRKEKRY